MNLLIVTFLPI